ncbi:MAG TPA: PAS domain S-box protein [Granulicella sp.]|nr:PAS domain S-box protein [Granulicella sp.]
MRLNIGPRLTLCFVVIILSMLGGDAVVLWQFHVVRGEAERMNGLDQRLVTVLRVHTSLLSFHDRLESLADSEDAGRLVAEAGPLQTVVQDETQRAIRELALLPVDLPRDPTILPTLEVIQGALHSQLEALTSLAVAGDWRAVHLRLANQIHPLESLTSLLVEKTDHEVGEEQLQTVLKIRRVERRVFLIVPLTGIFTLLLAAISGGAITRSITRPLARLVEGSRILAGGDFLHQVVVTGQDELAELGKVFNDTARRLRDLYANLQGSEDQLRCVISTIPAHVWSTLPDGSVDFVNQRLLAFTGFSPENLKEWKWDAIIHPDDRARAIGDWTTAVATGQPMESEIRLRRADGDFRYLLVRNVPLRNSQGHIVKWYGAGIEIEDRKRAEAQLRRNEAYLAEAQRLSRTGSFGWQVASGEMQWSEETYHIFACDKADTPSLQWMLQRTHPDDRDLVQGVLEQAAANGTNFDVEHRLLMPDGVVKYLQVVAHGLPDSAGHLEFVGAVIDITATRQAAQALRESEEKWRDVFDNNPTMYFIVDVSGKIIEINPFGAEQLGFKVAELLGQDILTVFDEADRVAIQRNIANCFAQLGHPMSWEARKICKDGTVLRVRETAKAVSRARGPIILIACEDTTEQKNAEEALRQALADLAHANRVSTMGELTASLAHEVNQPITAAITNASTCLRWLTLDEPNLDHAREAAARIVKDGRLAGDIIQRIRQLFKRGTPERDWVDVNDVIQEMLVLTRGQAKQYSIAVRVELATRLTPVLGDRVQLQQVMMNLIINSIDALKDVEGTRELAIQSRQLEDGRVLVSVSDTGVGLPPNQADKVFNAFFTTKPHGIGMGLRISCSIIESHGGRLWAADNPPRGAKFYLTLPTHSEPE